MRKRFFTLTFSLVLLCVFSFAQSRQGPHFSRQETVEILLDKSRKEKIRGFTSIGGGIALSGIGIHLVLRDANSFTPTGSGWTAEESDNRIWGKALLTLGIVSTLSSPILFVRAGRFKRKARLLLSDESTSFLDKRISIPSTGIQIGF